MFFSMMKYMKGLFMGTEDKQNKIKTKINSTLFLTFFKIGLFTFGGGYAMLPLIHAEVVDSKKWISNEQMLDMLAISESTPGPFAINAATFVGYHTGGFAGAAAATLGVITPPFIVAMIVSTLFNIFRDNSWVNAAFLGIRAGVVVLIINAVIKLATKMKWKMTYILLALLAFVLNIVFGINVIIILLISAIVGIIHAFINVDKSPKESDEK